MENGKVLSVFSEVVDPKLIWLGTKIFALLGIGIFVFFALSIFRQTQLMDKVLKIAIAPSFKTIALIYLILTLTYFFLAFLIL